MKNIIRLFYYIYYGVLILLRTKYYSLLFSEFGKNSLVLGKISVLKPERISVGDNCTINEGVFIGGLGGVNIGNSVTISSHVIIHSGYLDLKS